MRFGVGVLSIRGIIILGALTFLLTACADSSAAFEDARPNEANLIVTVDLGGGTLGGGATARAFTAETTFEAVIDGYETFVGDHEGESVRSGTDGWRYDLNGACVRVLPWHGTGSGRIRSTLDAASLARLDGAAGSFVEIEPDDCEFFG